MIIGVDIGGTNINAGSVVNGKIIEKITVKSPKKKKDILEKIIFIIDILDNSKVKAIGIGSPGPADYEKGIIKYTPHMELKGVNLKKLISRRFKKKVLMANDAQCFALGESIRLKKKNVIGLTLGTGTGGGIVIDGKMYKGYGNAGHLGHCTIKFDGPSIGFNSGSMESYISAKAIKRDYKASPSRLKSRKAWNEIGAKLGIGISNLINAFDPDVITLGGGISNAFNLFKNSMNKEISKRAIRKVPVIKGREDSNILGAASLF